MVGMMIWIWGSRALSCRTHSIPDCFGRLMSMSTTSVGRSGIPRNASSALPQAPLHRSLGEPSSMSAKLSRIVSLSSTMATRMLMAVKAPQNAPAGG